MHRPRGGRRLRREGPRLSRGDRRAGAGPPAGPPGQVGGDAARALPDGGGRPRPGPSRAHRRRPRRDHRRARDLVHARPRRVPAARRGHRAQHHQPPAGAVPGAELSRDGEERRHPQDLRRRLPRRRSPRGGARPRPAARPGGPSARNRPGRAAAAEHDPPRRDAVRLRPRLSRRHAHHLRRRRLPGRVRATCWSAWATRAGARSRPAAAGRRGPSASGSRPTPRAPGSGRSRAPTSASTATAPCSSTSASRPRVRPTRPRWPRSAPISSACRSTPSSCAAATPQLVGYGIGTIASRVAAVSGPAVARSASEVAEKARLVAAEIFECAPGDVALADGRVLVKGVPDRSLPLAEVARAAVRSRALARTSGPGLSACAFFYPDTVTWAFGAQAIVLEVDIETCAVSILRHAAVHDSAGPSTRWWSRGSSTAAWCRGSAAPSWRSSFTTDRANSSPARSWSTRCPAPISCPQLDVGHLDHPSAVNPLGIKGVGESGIIAPAAAVANAVEDALARTWASSSTACRSPARASSSC